MILEYFLNGTEKTVTGGHIGLEIETDFVYISSDRPISGEISRAIISAAPVPSEGYRVIYELGRQKIELAIDPQENIEQLLIVAKRALAWLYATANLYGAKPAFNHDFDPKEKLLIITEPRDKLWAKIDGSDAIEELCRCSSIQFTIDVSPKDAINIINKLWAAKIHKIDYKLNDERWKHYIATSGFNYRHDRYGGPSRFEDMEDYVAKLTKQLVTMHKGKAVRLPAEETPDLDIELYIRSIWWHRLRRYGNNLAIEVRPFNRRSDESIEFYWSKIAAIFGLNPKIGLPEARRSHSPAR